MSEKPVDEEKVSASGWIALIIMLCMFSGGFAYLKGNWSFLQFLDLNTLIGKFGLVGDTGANFAGSGGTGARAGFIFALKLAPAAVLAMGFIEVFTRMGVMKAFQKVFTPILRPLLGLPGVCGLPFVNSLNSSDISAILTRDYYDEGLITDEERSIFVAFQYPSSAPIGNMIATQAPLLPIAVVALGPLILMVILCKLIGANLMRLYLHAAAKKRNAKKGAK